MKRPHVDAPNFIEDDIAVGLPAHVTRRVSALDLLRQLLELQTQIRAANSRMVDPYPSDPQVQDEETALRAERDRDEARYMEVDRLAAGLLGRAYVDNFLLRVQIGQKVWPSEFLH